MTETARPSRTATLSRTTRESSVEVSLDKIGRASCRERV